MEVLTQFEIVRLRDCNDFQEEDWIGAPGFRSGEDGLVLEYAYEMAEDEEGINPWCLGVVFRSLRDAQHAVRYLASKGITPRVYHRANNAQTEAIKREIIENLPW